MSIFKHLTCVSAIAALLLTACGSDSPEPTPTPTPDNPVTPDNPPEVEDDVKSPIATFELINCPIGYSTDTQYQEMEGFGASDCWLPNKIGAYWSSYRRQIADWLFSRQIINGEPQGIGLSMWRVNLGAGTEELGESSGINNDNANNRAEAYLSANGSYNWNKCQGQRYFMQQAKNNGVESFVLFSNSPLVQFTKNGQGRSDNGAYANLKDECYGSFADYMAQVAAHFIADGYNISHISPVNEPQYNWDGHNQEGSGWQNAEVARLATALDKSLTREGLDTKILLSEAASWEYVYGGDKERQNTIDAFFNPSSAAYVGDLAHVDKVMAGHSYWTFDNWRHMIDVRSKAKQAADARGVRCWQTEWSMLDREPSELGGSYDDVSEFDIAQYMSRVIHNDIVAGGCTSWSYWTAMSVERWSQKNRFELIKTTPAGGEYSNDFTAEGRAVATPNLWVLGNYSLFVRPGYRRVELTIDQTKDHFGTAYISPDKSQLVIVITNYDKTRGLDLNFALPDMFESVYTYTTTASKHLKEARFNTKDPVFVDPASVTTIVCKFK